MDKAIRRLFSVDYLVIATFIGFMWCVLAFVLYQVLTLVSSGSIMMLSVLSAITVGTFSTASLLAVIGHLKRNRAVIYREDVETSLRNKGFLFQEPVVMEPREVPAEV